MVEEGGLGFGEGRGLERWVGRGFGDCGSWEVLGWIPTYIFQDRLMIVTDDGLHPMSSDL